MLCCPSPRAAPCAATGSRGVTVRVTSRPGAVGTAERTVQGWGPHGDKGAVGMVPVWGCGGLGCSSPSLVVSSEGMRGVGDLGLWGGDGGKQRGCRDRPWMGGCLGCACPEGGEGAGRGLGQRQTDRHEDRMGSEKITQTPPSPHPPMLLTTSPCVTSPQFSAPPGTVTPHTHTHTRSPLAAAPAPHFSMLLHPTQSERGQRWGQWPWGGGHGRDSEDV